MEYFTTAEVALLWGISQRRIAILCKEGRIVGAILKGRIWLIPKDAVRPLDNRKKILSKKFNDLCFEKVELPTKTLEKYNEIMYLYENERQCSDHFKKLYTGFYKIRRNQTFRDFYFNLLEESKTNKKNYSTLITEIFEFSGSVEASFASKLLATSNPDMPIWDSKILKILNINVPANLRGKEKLEFCIYHYDVLVNWYNKVLHSELGNRIINIFDEKNEKYLNISNVKKIDFILWGLNDE